MPELSLPLSNNFTLGEFLRSETAERDYELKREQENPPEEVIANLQYLVETTLQPVRDAFGYPIKISSGYRCQLLNKLVGGSATSQHCSGEAADCQLLPRFLHDPAAGAIREQIREEIQERTGRTVKPEINENFYLFAYVCLRLDNFDVDQIIHEYGEDFGRPAWVHISASTRQNKRQILAIGIYTNRYYLKPTFEEALAYGVA